MATETKILEKALELAVAGDKGLIEKFMTQAKAELASQDPLAGITAKNLEKASRDMGFTK
jgi:hypothetical protein